MGIQARRIGISGAGRRVAVLEGSFNVLGLDPVGRDARRRRPAAVGSSRRPLTGAPLASASDAALAVVPGASVTRAVAANTTARSGVAYAVLLTQADGRKVTVLEDHVFRVLSDPGHEGAAAA